MITKCDYQISVFLFMLFYIKRKYVRVMLLATSLKDYSIQRSMPLARLCGMCMYTVRYDNFARD